jgi:hypothetical protein
MRLREPCFENALALATYGPPPAGGSRSEAVPARRRTGTRRATATSGLPARATPTSSVLGRLSRSLLSRAKR